MTASPPRLTDAEKARVKRDHTIVDVLTRLGIDPPAHWDGASAYRVRAAALGFPYGRDDSQGVLIKPDENRWWAFHGGFGGDVIDLVRRITGTNSLASVAQILDSRARITVAGGDVDESPSQNAVVTLTGWEKPDLHRTTIERVRASNAAAWRYLTLPTLAERAREYLHGRGIDVTALEAEVGRPLAGRTPSSRTGLVDHLRGKGFSEEEILDSGWGTRSPGQPLRDRYRHRVLLPFRDDHGGVLGVTGRDITGTAAAKYLNHPKTLTFDKSALWYRPSTPELDHHATVIACEGTLDALAIAAAAARVGASAQYAPLTQSGLSLTDAVAPRFFALHPRPPILCGDADQAGQNATEAWVHRAMHVHHREVLTLNLPDGMDPADWLHRQGDHGLIAFTRTGCLDDDHNVRAKPAGGFLARRELERAIQTARATHPDVETVMVAPLVVERLGRRAAQVPDQNATTRFADEAGKILARLVDGMSAEHIARRVLEAAYRQKQSARADTTAPARVTDDITRSPVPTEATRCEHDEGARGLRHG